jgi:hypothetical protein
MSWCPARRGHRSRTSQCRWIMSDGERSEQTLCIWDNWLC